MVPEVDITAELLPRHVVALDMIRQLGARFGPGRWVHVGGMMVMIAGREHHARAPRAEATKDADILIDIVTNPSLLDDVTNLLETSGYRLAGWGVVCTVMGAAFIWETRRRNKAEVPDTIPEALLKDRPGQTPAAV